MRALFGLCVSLLAVACYGAELRALDDDDLAAVSAQATAGITLDIFTALNADDNGNPLPSLDLANNGGASCTNDVVGKCQATIAIQFDNRQGAWLVLKEVYGLFSVNGLQLDPMLNALSNTTYYNANRFVQAPGSSTCIADISSCNPAGMATFSLSFPGTSSSSEDIGLYLNIGRMSVQFDTSAGCTTVYSSGCGYNVSQDTNTSFAGLVISDMTQKMAQINVYGQVRVYGF